MALDNVLVGSKLQTLVNVCYESFQEIKNGGMKRHRAVKIRTIYGGKFHTIQLTIDSY